MQRIGFNKQKRIGKVILKCFSRDESVLCIYVQTVLEKKGPGAGRTKNYP